MRAATRTGMTFVGAHKQVSTDGADEFKARVIKPNQKARSEREAIRAAIAAKIAQLEDLMKQALAAGDEHLAEAEFWRQELNR